MSFLYKMLFLYNCGKVVTETKIRDEIRNMTTMTISDARNNLPELLNRVGYGQERILVERHGKPIAAIISLEDLRRLEAIEDAFDSAVLRRAVEENDGFVNLESIVAERNAG
jgi:prevent-host-death family protein